MLGTGRAALLLLSGGAQSCGQILAQAGSLGALGVRGHSGHSVKLECSVAEECSWDWAARMSSRQGGLSRSQQCETEVLKSSQC